MDPKSVSSNRGYTVHDWAEWAVEQEVAGAQQVLDYLNALQPTSEAPESACLPGKSHLPSARRTGPRNYWLLHSPEKDITMILAKGITLSTAEQWVHPQGLRGAINLPDGKVCMWSGGVPTLEYESEDWLELARRTLEEACFGSAPDLGTVCGDLPPIQEIPSRAEFTFAEGVYLGRLP